MTITPTFTSSTLTRMVGDAVVGGLLWIRRTGAGESTRQCGYENHSASRFERFIGSRLFDPLVEMDTFRILPRSSGHASASAAEKQRDLIVASQSENFLLFVRAQRLEFLSFGARLIFAALLSGLQQSTLSRAAGQSTF